MAQQTTILDRFLANVAKRPNDIYLTQPYGERVEDFSFARVLDEASRVATYLCSLGFAPGSQIAIASKNCAHFIISDIAIWLAGHVSVPLYPTLLNDTVRFILEHSEAKLLFVGKLDTWDEIRKGVPAELPLVAYPFSPADNALAWNDVLAKNEPLARPIARSVDAPVTIIYTSGSTGRPKGVVHSLRTLSAPTERFLETIEVLPSDRVLSYLPLAHAMDRWLSECLSMWVGNRLFFADSLSTFLQDVKRARPTLFLSVPRLWLKFQHGVLAKMPAPKLRRLLSIPMVSQLIKKRILSGLGLESVRFAASGSAPVPAELLDWYRNLGLEVLEGYGMTENFNYSHVTKPGEGRPDFIGHPQQGVECRLSDEGEVLVRSPGTMLGYFKEPAMTAAMLTPDGFLKTGDRGEIDAAGRLRLTGRVKELFKTSKGKYVAPVPIENMLNADGHVELSLVAGSGMPATHAVVQLAEHLRPKLSDAAVKAEISAALEQLLASVNRKVPDFERLAFIVVASDTWSTESGDLTPTMKLKRHVLEVKYQPRWQQWYSAERKVIWE